jgi:hypothetical protein
LATTLQLNRFLPIRRRWTRPPPFRVFGMTSTLLRKQSVELEVLLWSRQFRNVPFKDHSAVRLLSNAICSLRDAQRISQRSLVGRYWVACEGIYALCLGTLYLHGLLPTGQEGHRALVIQIACDSLCLSIKDRNKILESARQIEAIACDAQDFVEEPDVQDMVVLGVIALMQAKRVYPEWFT